MADRGGMAAGVRRHPRHEPDQACERDAGGAAADKEYVAPADRFDQESERCLAGHRAEHADRHGEAADESESLRRQPAVGQHQGADEGHAGASAEHQPSGIGLRQTVGEAEHCAAGGTDERGNAEQQAWAEAVDQQPDRDLHQCIGVEIAHRETTKRRATERKVAHQMIEHHRRRDALDEPIGEEGGCSAPHDPTVIRPDHGRGGCLGDRLGCGCW